MLYFYQSLIEKGLSVSTVDSVHTTVNPALKMAVRDRVIRGNPADGVMAELKKNMRSGGTVRHALTPAEERAFLDCLERPENLRWKPLFTFMFGTGCRVSEVIGIRWQDIDFDKKEIDINHNVTYLPREDRNFKCAYEVGDPKTETGIRFIPLIDSVRDALYLEKDNQEKYGYHNIMEIDGMSGFIFCNRFGSVYKPQTINKAIRRIVDDYNAAEEVNAKREHREPLILPRFSCHITRHTFCSRLCENGTNIKVIQQIMGHRDIRTTMDIYAEVARQTVHAVFEDLNEKDIL